MAIPYTIHLKDLKDYIVKSVPEKYRKMINKDVEVGDVHYLPDNVLSQLKKIAKKKGGKLLSLKYLGSGTNLEWQCKEGHTWYAQPGHVKNRGSWCFKCSYTDRNKNRVSNIEAVHALADRYEGKCLSKKYINSSTKIKWQCKEGHIWEALPKIIKNGQWCLECASISKLSKLSS